MSGSDDLADPAFADAGPERLRQRVLDAAGCADRAFYLAEPFASAYARSLREGFRQGPGGHAHHLALGFRTWPFRPEDVRVPADVWYGAEDASPVQSPDRGWRLATRLPRGRRLELPGEGGSLLWTRGTEVLRLLRAARLRP